MAAAEFAIRDTPVNYPEESMTQVAEDPMLSPPDHHGAAFGGITAAAPDPEPPGRPDFVAIRDSAEFAVLRRRFRRFVFPMSAVFFLWYLSYVLLAAYARDLMSHRLVGSVNVALVLGLLQFASTIAITCGYLRYARRYIDPQIAAIRRRAGTARR
jgi:uncharacterized membrane protein (DUF485 family)